MLLRVNFPLGKASLVLSRRHSDPLFKDPHVVFDIGKAAGCRNFLKGQDGVCVQKQILGGFNSRFMNG